jgi:hypothetical protein
LLAAEPQLFDLRAGRTSVALVATLARLAGFAFPAFRAPRREQLPAVINGLSPVATSTSIAL